MSRLLTGGAVANGDETVMRKRIGAGANDKSRIAAQTEGWGWHLIPGHLLIFGLSLSAEKGGTRGRGGRTAGRSGENGDGADGLAGRGAEEGKDVQQKVT